MIFIEQSILVCIQIRTCKIDYLCLLSFSVSLKKNTAADADQSVQLTTDQGPVTWMFPCKEATSTTASISTTS